MRAALDINILAYAEGVGDEIRCRRARDLIGALPVERVLIPAQVMGELYRVLTGKAGQPAFAAREAALGWADSFETAYSTWSAFLSAMDVAAVHLLQIRDALILSVAAENFCRLLLSEDLLEVFVWHGVTVINPLADTRNPLLGRLLNSE